MFKVGFDNEKYIRTQSSHIHERIAKFGNKLYLEFGGKLFDDHHASRVLPGFAPDSKMRMLLQLSSEVEIVIAINATDIEKNKVRGDLGITYDQEVLRLIDAFRGFGLFVGSVVITRFEGQSAAISFRKSEAVEFANQDLFVVWAAECHNDLLTYKAPEPNKTAIKQYLKAGGTLQGATLVERQNISIK